MPTYDDDDDDDGDGDGDGDGDDGDDDGDEPETQNEGACSGYINMMMNRNRQMRGRVSDIYGEPESPSQTPSSLLQHLANQNSPMA